MKIKNLIYNLVMAFLIGGICQLNFGVPAYAIGTAVFTVGAVAPFLGDGVKQYVINMAVQKEIWQNHVEEAIFEELPWLRKSKNADQYVIGGKAVHIPQSGGAGNVVKNRTVKPATVRKRVDTDVIYLIDEYTSDPVEIPDADKKELSYDKRESVIGEDKNQIIESIAQETLYNWTHSPVYNAYGATSIPASAFIDTTGAVKTATAPSATGNRLGSRLNDLQRMRTKFKNENRWFEGKMYALITPEMEAEMFPAESEITATYMAKVTEQERREGVMYKVQGWKIMTRSSILIVDNAGDIKAPGEIGATTDDEGSLFWYDGAVEFAYSGVELFQDLGNPLYYADIYSLLARSGGRAVRADYKGIGVLKQAKSA